MRYPFTIPHGGRTIVGDKTAARPSALVLHGAGHSCIERFVPLRRALLSEAVHTTAFDFPGHGASGGQLLGSSLHEREAIAASVARAHTTTPLSLIGASMSGHTAVRMTRLFPVATLILLVPAAYDAAAERVPFGDAFSAVIRSPGSWRNSAAYDDLSRFRGHLQIFAAQSDSVIPDEVIQRLYNAASEAASRELIIIPGATHMNLFHSPEVLTSAARKMASLLT